MRKRIRSMDMNYSERKMGRKEGRKWKIGKKKRVSRKKEKKETRKEGYRGELEGLKEGRMKQGKRGRGRKSKKKRREGGGMQK